MAVLFAESKQNSALSPKVTSRCHLLATLTTSLVAHPPFTTLQRVLGEWPASWRGEAALPRRLLVILLASRGGVRHPGACGWSRVPPQRPNVLSIAVDDLTVCMSYTGRQPQIKTSHTESVTVVSNWYERTAHSLAGSNARVGAVENTLRSGTALAISSLLLPRPQTGEVARGQWNRTEREQDETTGAAIARELGAFHWANRRGDCPGQGKGPCPEGSPRSE